MLLFALVVVLVTSGLAGATSAPNFVTKWGSLGSGDGQFYAAVGVAVDGSGNIYVTDSCNGRVQKFDSSGAFLTKWGSAGTGDGQFGGCGQFQIAVDGSGNVYVADSWNNRVEKFDSSGTFLTKWGSFGSGDGQFYAPSGIAVDGSGNVYVADPGNSRVQKFDSSGAFLTKWGSYGTGPGQMWDPYGIAVDGSGNVYVADTTNHRVEKWDSSGNFVTQWGSYGTGNGQFQGVYGVAVDGSGNVYIPDAGLGRVQKFDSSGDLLTKWGSPGTGDGQLAYPLGVAVDGSGNVYVADTSNSRIQKFAPTVPVAPDAPSSVVAAAGDGSARMSWLAPDDPGGAAISGYTITPHDLSTNSNGTPVPASGTNVTVGGLTNGDSYTFTVTATNSVGPSSQSAPSGNPPPATATGTASSDSATTVSTGGSPPPAGTATSVVVPAGTAGGTVSIAATGVTETAPSGFSFLGQQVNITAPDATATNPLVLVFQLDASLLAAGGVDVTTVRVFRNDSLVADCDASVTGASPDPCIASRVIVGSGAAELTVRTSQASHWNFGKRGFTISGLFQPVDNLPVLNSVKAGSAIPVKFSLGANQGLNIFTSEYPRSVQTACNSAAPIDAIEQTVSAGSSSLSYDAKTNQYTYVWKTDKSWSAAPGGPCRQLVLAFVDGSFLRANFKFK
jgi:hypothetical protein